LSLASSRAQTTSKSEVRAPSSRRWEYITFKSLHNKDGADWKAWEYWVGGEQVDGPEQSILQKLGADGWELVTSWALSQEDSFYGGRSNGTIGLYQEPYFKRPKN